MNYMLPEIFVIDSFAAYLKQIRFPHGCLLFSNNKIDQLFIENLEGFPFAAAIITYYFSEDTPVLYGGFNKPYKNISVKEKKYTHLCPELFEDLVIYKYALLEREDAEDVDPRIESISFDEERILEDMINNQKPRNL